MMNDDKLRSMMRYFDENLKDCRAQEEALRAAQRGDEAIFARIRGNVFDIFKTVLGVARDHEQDEDALKRFFFGRLESIPRGWEQALQQAEAHADAQRAHIEHIKLQAVRDIRAQAEELWGAKA